MAIDPTKFLMDADALNSKASSLETEAKNLVTALEEFDKLRTKMLGASLGAIHDKIESVVGEILPGFNQQEEAISSLAAELKKDILATQDIAQKAADKLVVEKAK